MADDDTRLRNALATALADPLSAARGRSILEASGDPRFAPVPGFNVQPPETPGFNLRLANALAKAPEAIWGSLPPTARSGYKSLAHALAELSPGAAVRDTVDASGRTGNALLSGDVWGTLGGGVNLLTAMAGVLPGMRITGSAHRAQNILSGNPYARLSDEQATEVVNRTVAELERTTPGAKWPSKDPVSSNHRLQTQANTLYPDLVPAPAPLADVRAAGGDGHAAWAQRQATIAAEKEAQIAAKVAQDNALLRTVGLPENAWTLPHRQQADALEAALRQRGIPHQRYSAQEGSRYYEIPVGPGENARTVKVRFADHANTSRVHDMPDYNITTGSGGNLDTGDHTIDQVIRVLRDWW